jgi:hypothetical protein
MDGYFKTDKYFFVLIKETKKKRKFKEGWKLLPMRIFTNQKQEKLTKVY